MSDFFDPAFMLGIEPAQHLRGANWEKLPYGTHNGRNGLKPTAVIMMNIFVY